jgi:hypothetical protein
MFRPSLVSFVAVAMVAGCATDSAETTDTFVFGLSAQEVLAAKRVSSWSATDAEWLDAHRGAFDCERYGSLCQAVGPEAAARITELGYRRAITGADADEVVRTQTEAIDAARLEWRALGITPYASDTETTTGSGASNRRLIAHVESNYLWPAHKLSASGDCSTQIYVAGLWLPESADNLCGTLRATFNDGRSSEQTFTAQRCVTFRNLVSLSIADKAAETSTVKMSCSADNDLWSATRSADVDELAWF